MKAEGLDYDQRMEQLEKLEYPKPTARLRLLDVQRLRRPAPLGGRGEHPPEVDRARDVRGLPLLLRLHPGVRPGAGRGPAAPPPQQRLQGPRPDRARRGEDRHRARDGAVPARHAARGGLEPARRVGEDARPGLPARSGRAERTCGRRGRRSRRTSPATRRRSPPPSARGSSPSCAPGRSATTRPRSATIDAPGDADGQPWTVERLRAAREAHRVEHAGLRLDPEARNLRHTHVRAVRRPRALARPADARGPRGPQRLGRWSSTWTSPPRASWASPC